MANAPHMQNTNGVANNYLNGEARKNGAATAVGAAVR